MYQYKYPHPSVTTDCVVFGYDAGRLYVLLIERGDEPYRGRWAFPGGFLEMDETAEEGAARELREETGLTGVSLRQVHALSHPRRDPRERVITVAFCGLTRRSAVAGADDARRAQWFAIDELPPLAFDHGLLWRMAVRAMARLIRLEPHSFEWQEGGFDGDTLRRIARQLEQLLPRRRILFVCHGNICRSPMAEYVMKWLVWRAGLADDYYIESAATSTEELGNPVYPPARRMLQEHGIVCPEKRARQLRRDDYQRFDLLIGMDEANIRNMRRICGGDPEGKIRLLMDYTHRPGDVADPWYTADFEATWRDVLEGCQGLLQQE